MTKQVCFGSTFSLVVVSAITMTSARGQNSAPARYAVTDLGTLSGGTYSYASAATNSGLVAGHASPPDGTWRAVMWHKDAISDIGSLGIGQSNSVAFGINEAGQVTGEAETWTQDPYREDFCGFKALGLPSFGHTCLPFLWQNGVMHPLPTLGGPNGSASQINNVNQVVGYAENAVRDPACPAPQRFQFKPVLWTNAQPQELPTAPGDLEGIALGINDLGHAVGASGSCAAFNPNSQVYLEPQHALLWRNAVATDLGNLGGTGAFGGNIACAINNQGQVVGNSDLKGDTTTHGFLWTDRIGMQDLKPFPGDAASVALNLNERGDVVGVSLDANFNPRAVIWENGVPLDLNNVIPANSGLYLQAADSINARGEIVGFAQTSTGDTVGFLLSPVNGGVADARFEAAQGPIIPAFASEKARKLLRRRLRFGPLGARLAGGSCPTCSSFK